MNRQLIIACLDELFKIQSSVEVAGRLITGTDKESVNKYLLAALKRITAVISLLESALANGEL